jgi:hypothetical protein
VEGKELAIALKVTITVASDMQDRTVVAVGRMEIEVAVMEVPAVEARVVVEVVQEEVMVVAVISEVDLVVAAALVVTVAAAVVVVVMEAPLMDTDKITRGKVKVAAITCTTVD